MKVTIDGISFNTEDILYITKPIKSDYYCRFVVKFITQDEIGILVNPEQIDNPRGYDYKWQMDQAYDKINKWSNELEKIWGNNEEIKIIN